MNYPSELGGVRVYALTGAYNAVASTTTSKSEDAIPWNFSTVYPQLFYDKKGLNKKKSIINESGNIKSGDNGNKIILWEFFKVWVVNLGQPKFTTEVAGPMKVNVEFAFMQCRMPGFGSHDLSVRVE